MDALTDILNTLRLQNCLYCRAELGALCDLHFLPYRMPVLHAVYQGSCSIQLDGDIQPIQLASGDIMVLPDGCGHVISTNAAVGEPTGSIIDVDFEKEGSGVKLIHAHGWDVTTILLCVTLNFEDNNRHPLLKSLPRALHITQTQAHLVNELEQTLRLLDHEAVSERPGALTMVQRLTDMLFVQVVRSWVECQHGVDGWIGALRDPQISSALQLIHARPDEDWTVGTLAQTVALSRSLFTERFAQLVGEPPMKYLTSWRMQKAAGLMQSTNLSMSEVSQRVGYESEFAFNRAFKRWYGVAPGQYRRLNRRLNHHS